MYPNYIQDRKLVGYKALLDIKCGSKLVLITDSTFLFVKNVRLKGKQKIIVMIGVMMFVFSVPESALAIGTSPVTMHTPPIIVTTTNPNILIKPSMDLDLDIEPKIVMPNSVRIKLKSRLKDVQWLNELFYGLRGGDDKELIKSIISKVSESEYIPSINKILKRVMEIALKYGTNEDVIRMLAELQKPLPQSTIFVEGWVNPLPQYRPQKKLVENPLGNVCTLSTKKLVENPAGNMCTPSIESVLELSRCYARREDFDIPRSVVENFGPKSVKKLAKVALKSPDLKNEYQSITTKLSQGIHPVKISERSTYVSADMVLIKKPVGRYLVKISDSTIEIVGFSRRSNLDNMRKFAKLMNELYNVDIKGY